jgi:hypothetical protein
MAATADPSDLRDMFHLLCLKATRSGRIDRSQRIREDLNVFNDLIADTIESLTAPT